MAGTPAALTLSRVVAVAAAAVRPTLLLVLLKAEARRHLAAVGDVLRTRSRVWIRWGSRPHLCAAAPMPGRVPHCRIAPV